MAIQQPNLRAAPRTSPPAAPAAVANAAVGPSPVGPADPFLVSFLAGERSAYSNQDTIDPAFRETVARALYFHNIPVNSLTADQMDAIVRKLWAHPLLQEAFNEANDPTSSSISITSLSEVSTLVGRELFDPGSSSSPDLLAAGFNLKQQFGVPLTASERAYHVATNDKVPVPFAPSLFDEAHRTEYFGEVTGFGTEPGNDYGMDPGTPITSPFSGTVQVEDNGKAAWGKRLILTLDAPITMPDGTVVDQIGVGHLTQFAVTSGRLEAGDVLGYSGGAVDDPSSGASSGPHIEFQTLSGGRFVDPAPLLQKLYSGATFADLGATGMQARTLTPDEQQLRTAGIYSTVLNSINSGAVTAWRKFFGTEPTTQQLLTVLAHGKDAAQYEDYIRSLDSPSLPGYGVGAVYDARTLADKESQKIYGHDSNLGIVKDLLDQNMRSASDIAFYYDQMQFRPGKDVPVDVYNTAYAANRVWSQGVFNSEPDPRTIKAQVTAAGGAAPTPAQVNLAAQSLAPAPVTETQQNAAENNAPLRPPQVQETQANAALVGAPAAPASNGSGAIDLGGRH